MANKRVVVIGAGVSGLTTATLLLQQDNGIKVHLVAEHFPGDLSGDYTSPWAGAHWRSAALKDNIKEQEYDKETFNHFWRLAETTAQEETGIMIIDGFDYWEQFSQEFSDPWFKTLCPEFRKLRKEELPTGIEFGVTYKTVSINPSTYLVYLLNTFRSLGGTTQRVSLSHLNECIENDTDVVINCSGIRAGTLGGVKDSEVYPARGQTVIVQLPQNLNWTFLRHSAGSSNGRPLDGNIDMTYVIPRENGEVILGGTYDRNNYSTDDDDNITAAIIQRCLDTRPDLLPPGQTQLKVKRSGVGLRPCRKSGIRVEGEWITSEKFGKRILVCHNYGHGGAGYQSSYGTARHVIKIMNEMLENQEK